MKKLTTLFVLAGAAGLTACGPKLPEHPNLIYILADDLGYGDIGVNGQKLIQTPNIDRLAAEGIQFSQHYAGSTVCAPSRCCLMTGMHTGHSVVRGNRPMKPEGQAPMPEGTVTIAQLLHDAGYVTGMFGKWGLGGPGSVSEPMNAGFDEFYGYNCQRHAHRYYTDYLWHNRERDSLPENRNNQMVTYSQDKIMEYLLKFIRDYHDTTFFLYAPFTLPHAELQVPDENRAPYMGKFKETPFKGGYYRAQEYPKATFAGMVSRLDKDVGRIVNLVQTLGIADHTLLIFTSDNGPHKEGGADPDFFDSNGIFRGYKRDLYEGGIREPFIAWWPGIIAKGSHSDHLSAFWDFMPTACDLVGISSPEGIDGISYLPALLGRHQPAHDYLYWEFHEQGGKQAVRMGDWKAVRLQVSRMEHPATELYNLAEDPSETHDLSSEKPEILKKIETIMETAHTPDPKWPLLFSEKKRGKQSK